MNRGTRTVLKVVATVLVVTLLLASTLTAFGHDILVTGQPAAVETISAVDVGNETATLRGDILLDVEGNATHYAWVWGNETVADYPGNTTPANTTYPSNWVSSEGNYEVDRYSEGISGLEPDTRCYFRFAARIDGEWHYGDELYFDTLDLDLDITVTPSSVDFGVVRPGQSYYAKDIE